MSGSYLIEEIWSVPVRYESSTLNITTMPSFSGEKTKCMEKLKSILGTTSLWDACPPPEWIYSTYHGS